MSNDKICTESELRNFAWNSEPTAFNFARWLESKTNDKYTIVEKQFIRELLLALDDHSGESLKKKWQEAITMLML